MDCRGGASFPGRPGTPDVVGRCFTPQRQASAHHPVRIVQCITLAERRKDLGVAELGPAERLSAAEVRRLACTASIIPAVLDGNSEVLDLGRTSKLFKPARRKAMIIRDRECRAEGCTIPAAWCEAHHWGRPWAQGGHTDLEAGVLLCSWHHHRAHDPTDHASRMPNGDIRFSRRT